MQDLVEPASARTRAGTARQGCRVYMFKCGPRDLVLAHAGSSISETLITHTSASPPSVLRHTRAGRLKSSPSAARASARLRMQMQRPPPRLQTRQDLQAPQRPKETQLARRPCEQAASQPHQSRGRGRGSRERGRARRKVRGTGRSSRGMRRRRRRIVSCLASGACALPARLPRSFALS